VPALADDPTPDAALPRGIDASSAGRIALGIAGPGAGARHPRTGLAPSPCASTSPALSYALAL